MAISFFQEFNTGINTILDMLSFDAYHIERNRKYYCTCVDASTKEGDVRCKKCLGIGYRIKIRKTKAHIQPSTTGNTMRVDHIHNFKAYIRSNGYEIKPEDILIYDNNIGQIIAAKKYFTDSSKAVYYECTISPKKQYSSLFLKNFKEIVGDR